MPGELHDVVAHHVSVMGVLATGARRVLPSDPAATDGALGSIEETSRSTLRELRRLLDVLRTDAESVAELAPQPSLAGIETLIEQVREAGLPVSLRVDGVPAPLDPGVALTVFRIVQEALTNTIKHAGTATAAVRLSFGVYWLVVEISDTGRGPRPEGNRLGHGLVGMRERVALYGGSLRTGPRPGGGFRVYAKIPMEGLGAPSSEETSMTEGGGAARPVRILLVDDQPLLRTGFRMVLGAEPDLDIVGEAGDGSEAVDLARRLLPDVVLMDIRMPRLDGVAATRAIVDARLPVRVLILTTFDLDEYVVGALRAGASGFLAKDVPAEDLVTAIRTVAAGDAVVAPRILKRLLDRFADSLPDPSATLPKALNALTEREREVLVQMARGLSNAEIARALSVSETTIKTHVGHVLTKLGLRDRVQAVVLAYETGLVRPGG